MTAFRVVSFNVLANSYCSTSRYKYANPNVLEVTYRQQLLLKELQHLDADIIALQEVDFYMCRRRGDGGGDGNGDGDGDDILVRAGLRQQLHQRGYESHFLKRTGKKKDGLVTAWKKSVFQIDHPHPHPIEEVKFDDLASDATLLGLPISALAAVGSRFRRHHVGLIIRLRHLETNKIVLAANTRASF